MGTSGMKDSENLQRLLERPDIYHFWDESKDFPRVLTQAVYSTSYRSVLMLLDFYRKKDGIVNYDVAVCLNFFTHSMVTDCLQFDAVRAAVAENNIDLLRILLSQEKIDLSTKKEHSSLHILISEHQLSLDILGMLLEDRRLTKYSISDAIEVACTLENPEILKLLLLYGRPGEPGKAFWSSCARKIVASENVESAKAKGLVICQLTGMDPSMLFLPFNHQKEREELINDIMRALHQTRSKSARK